MHIHMINSEKMLLDVRVRSLFWQQLPVIQMIDWEKLLLDITKKLNSLIIFKYIFKNTM